MERYRVWFKVFVELDAKDAEDALECALDDLAYMTVTDHSEDKLEEQD